MKGILNVIQKDDPSNEDMVEILYIYICLNYHLLVPKTNLPKK